MDGTLCTTLGSEYVLSTPKPSRIRVVNTLYQEGHHIIIFTARGGTSGRDWSELTRGQLQKWGVMHHQLILGKPAADFYIDDKGTNDKHFFSEADSSESLTD